MRLSIICCMICCSIYGHITQGQTVKPGNIIKATALFLTDKRFSIDSVSRLMMTHTGIQIREYPVQADNSSIATDTSFAFFESADTARFLLRLSTFKAPAGKDAMSATAVFFIAGGYDVKAGKVVYEREDMHQLSIIDLEKVFGPYKEDPFNKLRKESRQYTFNYLNPATKRRAVIEVSCVFRAHAAHNFISTVTNTPVFF